MGSVEALIKRLEPIWQTRIGASMLDINDVEAELGIILPSDYKTFLRWSNGGFASIGDTSVRLWSTDDIYADNNDYEFWRYLPGVVAIGTDGGEIAYALDYRGRAAPHVVQVPLGCLRAEKTLKIADSFEQWIASVVGTLQM